jgi:outer membrane receptor protein involved in Fe transport
MSNWTRRFVSVVPTVVGLSMLGAVLSAAPVAAQQEAPLQGFVVDELTGEVISSARVSILGTEMETRTGGNGTFAFADPPLGPVSVRVQAEGYPAVVDEVQVEPDGIVFMHVVLPQVQIVLGELLIVGEPTARRERRSEVATTAADLLAQQVPGAFRAQGVLGNNDARIVLRGVSSISLSSDPAVYLDGVRISGGLSEALDALSRIPAEHVRRVRVLRGPSSAWVQGSANGAVLIETRSGIDEGQ